MSDEMELNYREMQLTAHVLSELEEGDSLHVAEALSRDPDAKEQAEAVRLTAMQLQDELQAESMPGLTDLQKLAIEARLSDMVADEQPGVFADRSFLRRQRFSWAVAGAAATIVLMIGLAGVITALWRQIHAGSDAPSLAQQDEGFPAAPYFELVDPRSPRAPSREPGQFPPLPIERSGIGSAQPGALELVGAYDALAEYQADPRPEAWPGEVDARFRSTGQFPSARVPLAPGGISFTALKRSLERGQFPEPDSIAVDQLVNHLTYDVKRPETGASQPLAMEIEVGPCPWNEGHQLARLTLAARDVVWHTDQPRNLVFLIDVSGSMDRPHKLPALKQAIRRLAHSLTDRDRLAFVVYSGNAGLVLAPTTADRLDAILTALDRLESGGPTHDLSPVELAYATARKGFVFGGINRVIVATDGDFNFQLPAPRIEQIVKSNAAEGVSFSMLDFARPAREEAPDAAQLTAHAGGRYAPIDSSQTALRVLVEQCGGEIEQLAEDVQATVAFNPDRVDGYRLVGYDRLSPTDVADGSDDTTHPRISIRSGDMVTALFEIVPRGSLSLLLGANLVSREPGAIYADADGPQGVAAPLLTATVDFRQPPRALGDQPRRDQVHGVAPEAAGHLDETSRDFRIAAAAAGFGMVLRDSPLRANLTLERVRALAAEALDGRFDRRQLLAMIDRAIRISDEP